MLVRRLHVACENTGAGFDFLKVVVGRVPEYGFLPLNYGYK